MKNIQDYTLSLRDFLSLHGNNEIAAQQSQYMRNQFPFFGIKKSELSKLFKQFEQKNGKINAESAVRFCHQCIAYQEREMWYIGLEILIKNKKCLKAEDFDFVQILIVDSDWWDIVDMVATHLVGELAKKYAPIQQEVNTWVTSDNLWLKRTSIIYQLKYKEAVNEVILYHNLLICAEEKEFFIRKAIGWALREYAKVNPKSVSNFIETNRSKLSNLSIKEGSKYLI